jgi:ABC-type amino acid transport system permease subunit
MSTFALTVLIIAIAFVMGSIFGILAIIAMASRREDRGISVRYKGSNLSLNSKDPHDAEKIVQRWLAARDHSIERDSE